MSQENTYVYGAASVIDGILDTLILPYVNADYMQVFLDEVASRHPGERTVMDLDGAGWHKVKSLRILDNLELVFLPPYSPELNPIEHIYDDLREKSLHNFVFDSLDALQNHLEVSIREMECDH